MFLVRLYHVYIGLTNTLKKELENEPQEKIYNAIADLANNQETVLWSEIMEAVGSKIKVKNWMEVRGILKFAVDEKELVRTNDLSIEQYKVINKMVKF